MIGIGVLCSSCPVIRIPVYATAMEEFWMLRVQFETLNEICRDHSHLQNIRFPAIRDNRIRILIGADTFTATVPRQFTTGPTGTPYGVNTLLGWTLTGPIPQRYTQKRVGQSNSTNITVFISGDEKTIQMRIFSTLLDNWGSEIQSVVFKGTVFRWERSSVHPQWYHKTHWGQIPDWTSMEERHPTS